MIYCLGSIKKTKHQIAVTGTKTNRKEKDNQPNSNRF